jgi:hypothetical protein
VPVRGVYTSRKRFLVSFKQPAKIALMAKPKMLAPIIHPIECRNRETMVGILPVLS